MLNVGIDFNNRVTKLNNAISGESHSLSFRLSLKSHSDTHVAKLEPLVVALLF